MNVADALTVAGTRRRDDGYLVADCCDPAVIGKRQTVHAPPRISCVRKRCINPTVPNRVAMTKRKLRLARSWWALTTTYFYIVALQEIGTE